MLKKLLKHEFRYYRKFMLITMMVMVVSVLFIRLAIVAFEHMPSNVDTIAETLMNLASLPLMMLCMVLYYTALLSLAVPHVFGAVRYYRNLTQDQGYLSFTLPVRPSYHVFCKTFVPLVWTFILIRNKSASSLAPAAVMCISSGDSYCKSAFLLLS